MPDKSPRGEIGHRIDSSSMHFLSQLQGFVSDPFVIENRNIFCVVLFHSLYKKIADQGEGYLQVFTTWYEELLRSNKYLFSAYHAQACVRLLWIMWQLRQLYI
jgi:hypothetical protein